jgi:hypothetical protein
MKSFVPYALLAVLALTLPIGCGEDDDDDQEQTSTGGAGGSEEEGLRMCCELGALCHRVGEPTNAEMEECHELGHENVPGACRENYERCIDLCAAGGAGGASTPHACL